MTRQQTGHADGKKDEVNGSEFLIDSYLKIWVSLFIPSRYPCAAFFQISHPYSCSSHFPKPSRPCLAMNAVSVGNLACIGALTIAGVLLAFTTGEAQGLAKVVAFLDTTTDDALGTERLGLHDKVA